MIKYTDLKKDIYKPNDVADLLGCSVRTIQNYCKQGKIKECRNIKNRRYFEKQDLIDFLSELQIYYDDCKSNNKRFDAIYARVSTNKQNNRGDLDRQIEKVSVFAVSQNPISLKIFKDVGSGLNDNRKNLLKLMNLVMENKVNKIFILYKDRLTRFGFNYLKTICDKHNTKIIIVSEQQNDKTTQEELAEDIIAIIHSFSGKLYGMRKTIQKIIDKEIKE